MTTDDTGADRVRTSDTEREHVAETLRDAVSEGRLTLEEGDQRLAALYATKYRDELPPLIADLPHDAFEWDRPAAGAAAAGPGRGPGGPGRRGAPPWAGPGRSGPGFDPRWARRWAAFRIVRFAVLAALIVMIAHAVHLFWLIPVLLLTVCALRIGWFGRCGRRRGWGRSGWDRSGWAGGNAP